MKIQSNNCWKAISKLNLDYATIFSLAPYIINNFSQHYLNANMVYMCPWILIPVTQHSTSVISSKRSLRLFSTSISKVTMEEEELRKTSDEEFYEWLRGLVDGEGTFGLKSKNNGKNFEFRFRIFMHIDEKPLLLFLQSRLGIGKVYSLKKSVEYNVFSFKEIRKIIDIFSQNPLNSTKHLNFWVFKKAFDLYDSSKDKSSPALIKQLNDLKGEMNKARTDYSLAEKKFKITPYWVLGFVEGEGSFYIRKNNYYTLGFSLNQSIIDLALMEELKNYFMEELPKKYISGYSFKGAVSLVPVKGKSNSRDSAIILIGNKDYFKKVLIPFFDSMVWQSKKQWDYLDWKIVLAIKELGLHKLDSGIKVIDLIVSQMNLRRLTTNSDKYTKVDREHLNRLVDKLLKKKFVGIMKCS